MMLTRVAITLTAVAVAAAGTVALTRHDGEATSDLVAYFDDASPLEVGSQIRASGVRVGTVRSIRLHGADARVELELDEAVLPVRKDAALTIKPVNLLGETYIDLDQGSPDQEPLEGEVPVKQTSSAVTLQDVLDTFDDPGAAGLAGLVTTLGQGAKGNGDEVNAAIRALAPTMLEAERLAAILDEQNGVLADLVAQSAPVAEAVSGKDGAELDALLDSTVSTLTTLNNQSTALKATIANLPGALSEARRTLDELSAVSDDLTPTIRELRPVTGDLREIATELKDFSAAVDPAMEALQPVLAEARKLIGTVAPIVAALRDSGDDLVATAASAAEAGDVVLGTHLNDIMAFVRKWSLATNSRDALSHYFRGVLHVTPMAVDTLLGTDLTSGATGGPVDLPTNDLVGDVADLLEQVGPIDQPGATPRVSEGADSKSTSKAKQGDEAAEDLEKTLDDLDTQTTREDRTSATGLSSSQELALLEQLVGGTR